MKRTVVILLSDKRSGSTMFQNELCQHPSIQTVAYSSHTYLETHHWLKGAVMLGSAPETFAGGKAFNGYGSRSNARTYLIDTVRGNIPSFVPPRENRKLLFEGWEALCDHFAQPIFFEKSPQFLAHWAALSLILEWIQITKFKVKVIGLTRNPMSVQYSAWNLFHTTPAQRQFGWLELQRNLLAFQALLPQNAFLAVKYEDIIKDAVASFADICKFIGVDPDSSIGESVHDRSLTKWKEDPFFSLEADPSVRQIAKHFRYSDAELDNPQKPPPPIGFRIRKRVESVYKLGRARFRDRYIKPIYLRMLNHNKTTPKPPHH